MEYLHQKAPVNASSEEGLESVAFNEVCEIGSDAVLERWTRPTFCIVCHAQKSESYFFSGPTESPNDGRWRMQDW